jgi:uncharacterized membrane-anchored protein
MADRLDEVIVQATASGVLPASAARPQGELRPWPVVLLTALGAWLAAVPLLGVVGMLLGPLVNNIGGPYIVGVLALAGSVVLLRSTAVPLFVEQLAVPGLLVGLGSLGFGLYRDLPDAAASLVLAAVALGLALALRQPWLRVLLGAAMAVLVGFALLEPERLFRRSEHEQLWVVSHLLLIVGLLMPWAQGLTRRKGAVLESVSAGWLLVVLAGLAVLSGMTFLVGGVMGGGLVGAVAREVGQEAGRRSFTDWGLPLASAFFAVVGAAVAARRWPGLRHPGLAVVAAVVAGLSWFMPTLGGVVLALGCLLSSQRWRLGTAAAVAFAWIVGAFYYALAWPLATKALVLVGAGALIGAVAWWLKGRAAQQVLAVAVALDRRALWVALTTVATLVIAAGAIAQKQDLITRGQAVYVELAPVDPRSLMQGDYMRLEFRVPVDLRDAPPAVSAERPKVVARRDARGVATLLRVAKLAEPLAAGEFLLELTPKNGRWILVSDAWFFREGDAERWERARYGEFRVTPEGRALLVGMADEKLQAIKP